MKTMLYVLGSIGAAGLLYWLYRAGQPEKDPLPKRAQYFERPCDIKDPEKNEEH